MAPGLKHVDALGEHSVPGATLEGGGAASSAQPPPSRADMRISSIVDSSSAQGGGGGGGSPPQDTPLSGTRALGSRLSDWGETQAPTRLESDAVRESPSMHSAASAAAAIPRSNSWSAPATQQAPPSGNFEGGGNLPARSPTAQQDGTSQSLVDTLAHPGHARSVTDAGSVSGSHFTFRDGSSGGLGEGGAGGGSANPWDMVGMDMEDALRSMQPGANVIAPHMRVPLPSPHIALGVAGGGGAGSALSHVVSQPVGQSAAMHGGVGSASPQTRSQSVRGLQLSVGAAPRIQEVPSEEEDGGSLGGHSTAAGGAHSSLSLPLASEARENSSLAVFPSHSDPSGATVAGGAALPLPPAVGHLPRVQLLPSAANDSSPPQQRVGHRGNGAPMAHVPGAMPQSPPTAPSREGGAAAASSHAHSPSSAHSSASHAPSFCALVVDDVAPTRKLVARVLKRKCGVADTMQAGNGKEAVDIIAASMKVLPSGQVVSSIAVITMDMSMPVMDGVQATRAIRELGFTGPIVGLTGNALQADVHSLREAGADRVCTKPVDAEVLRATVLQLLSAM